MKVGWRFAAGSKLKRGDERGNYIFAMRLRFLAHEARAAEANIKNAHQL